MERFRRGLNRVSAIPKTSKLNRVFNRMKLSSTKWDPKRCGKSQLERKVYIFYLLWILFFAVITLAISSIHTGEDLQINYGILIGAFFGLLMILHILYYCGIPWPKLKIDHLGERNIMVPTLYTLIFCGFILAIHIILPRDEASKDTIKGWYDVYPIYIFIPLFLFFVYHSINTFIPRFSTKEMKNMETSRQNIKRFLREIN